MNEQTTQLLQELAAKLGTTAEHLWAVLIAQAPITAVVTLVQFSLIGLAAVGLWRLRNKLRVLDALDYAPLFIVYAVCWLIVGIGVLCAFDELPRLAAAFFNPEYWALKEVLSVLAHK